MKLVDFLLAEDIRSELGNKHSVMGVFGDSITLSIQENARFPLPFRLASFIRLQFDDDDPEEFSFVYDIHWDSDRLAHFEGTGMKDANHSLFALPLVAAVIPLHGAGQFRCHLQLKAGDRVIFNQDLRPLRVVIEFVKRPDAS